MARCGSFRGMTGFDSSDGEWAQLLGRSTNVAEFDQLSTFHAGKAVLIPGAGGSIGSALAVHIARSKPRVLVLLDASEAALYRIDRILGSLCPEVATRSLVGSVADRPLLEDAFRRYRPDLVYHAAAYKHVPLMEANPFAAIQNNALGTDCLAQVAADHGAAHLLMISTDKAADPISIMGASKRIAELALQVHSRERAPMDSIRLGNILGTQGSVIPHFLEQISRGGPVTVTHPEAERFFFTLDEAIALMMSAIECARGGQVLIPQTHSPTRILALAQDLIRKHGGAEAGDIPIVFTGLRPGDKMREQFVAADERSGEDLGGGLRRLESSAPAADAFAAAMAELDRTARARSALEMLQAIWRLAPSYTPAISLSGTDDRHG